MPFVSRPKPTPSSYDPINLKSLIARYDTSITTSIGISASFINSINDQSINKNNLSGTNVRFIINDGISIPVLSNNSFLINNSTEMRYQTTGVTVFVVASIGYPIPPTDIISIFGTSNSSLTSFGNAAFLRIDSNNYLYATNGINNAGANTLLVNNSNIPQIITGVFNKTTSKLSISGNDYGSAVCTNTFGGDDNNYVIQIGTPNNYYNNDIFRVNAMPTLIQRTNGIFEVLVYNSVLTIPEINRIEQYLIEKWPVSYPVQDFRTYSNVMKVPHLLLWLNTTNDSNISFNNLERTQINTFYSSENLRNTFVSDTNIGPGAIYNRNDKRISFTDNAGTSPLFPIGNTPIGATGYNNITSLFTGTGDIYGITIFTLLSSKALATSVSFNTILAVFTPQNPNLLDERVFPTILQDTFGNIFIGSNIYDNRYLSFPFNMGVNTQITSSYTNQSFLLTTQITSENIQMWVNGYSLPQIQAPMLISNNIRGYISNNSLGCYIGGVPALPDPGNGYSNCSTEIGEVLIYKKALNATERNTVNTYIYSNYNISPNISSNGLVGWWDANDITYNNSGSNVLQTWAGKYTSPILSIDSVNSVSYLRRYVNPQTQTVNNFVDLNNGNPSVLKCTTPGITFSNALSIFMVTTGSFNNSGVVLDTVGTNILDINITTSYNVAVDSISFFIKNSLTNLNSNNLYYITTCSLIESRTNNIYSIPAGQENVRVTEISDRGTHLTNLLYVGGTSNNFFRNSIGELIIYNRTLSNGEYTNILAYLQSKWEFPLRSYGEPNSISDLLLWYDANNLNSAGTDTTWSSRSGYGQPLDRGVGGGNIPITTLNNNTFFNMNASSPVFNTGGVTMTIKQEYTYFVVTRPGTTDGDIILTSPTIPSEKNYPGLHLSNGRYMIVSSSNSFNTRFTDFRLSDTCHSLIRSDNYPGINLNNINITSINHRFNSNLSMGSYTIKSKGTLYEKSSTNISELPYSPAGEAVNLSIGGISRTNYTYNGLIGEFLFYNRSLNDLEELSIFKYLEGKWLNSGGPNNPCF